VVESAKRARINSIPTVVQGAAFLAVPVPIGHESTTRSALAIRTGDMVFRFSLAY
jgi:hypothetical protein